MATLEELTSQLAQQIATGRAYLLGTIERPATPGRIALVGLERPYRGLMSIPAVAVQGCESPGRCILLWGDDNQWYAFGGITERIILSESVERSQPSTKSEKVLLVLFRYRFAASFDLTLQVFEEATSYPVYQPGVTSTTMFGSHAINGFAANNQQTWVVCGGSHPANDELNRPYYFPYENLNQLVTMPFAVSTDRGKTWKASTQQRPAADFFPSPTELNELGSVINAEILIQDLIIYRNRFYALSLAVIWVSDDGLVWEICYSLPTFVDESNQSWAFGEANFLIYEEQLFAFYQAQNVGSSHYVFRTETGTDWFALGRFDLTVLPFNCSFGAGVELGIYPWLLDANADWILTSESAGTFAQPVFSNEFYSPTLADIGIWWGTGSDKRLVAATNWGGTAVSTQFTSVYRDTWTNILPHPFYNGTNTGTVQSLVYHPTLKKWAGVANGTNQGNPIDYILISENAAALQWTIKSSIIKSQQSTPFASGECKIGLPNRSEGIYRVSRAP